MRMYTLTLLIVFPRLLASHHNLKEPFTCWEFLSATALHYYRVQSTTSTTESARVTLNQSNLNKNPAFGYRYRQPLGISHHQPLGNLGASIASLLGVNISWAVAITSLLEVWSYYSSEFESDYPSEFGSGCSLE